jgi:predicted Zn-dependent protease
MGLEAPISRRSVLLFGTGIAWGAGRQMHLSLLPLYTKEYKPVSSGFLTAVRTALEKMYLIVTAAREPEFYKGADEANVLLDYLSLRDGRVMGIMSAPLRARSPNFSGLKNVCGNAYTPNDLHEWPAASIITTYEFRNMDEAPAQQHLGVIAVHELGHNLGAWDCTDRSCYMYGEVDISGKYLPSKFCMTHRGLLWQYLR